MAAHQAPPSLGFSRQEHWSGLPLLSPPVSMAILKKKTSSKCWWGSGEKVTFLHCWWEYKLPQPLWKTVWKFLKKVIELTYDPTFHFQLFIWRKQNITSKRYMYPHVHCSIIYKIAKVWKQPVFFDGWMDKLWNILLRRKKFSSTSLGSSGLPKNSIEMRQINRRKSNESLITGKHERDPGKQNGQSPHLKYNLQLKTKKDIGDSGLGLQRGERQ